MTFIIIGILYMVISIFMFRYSIKSDVNNLKSYGYAVLLNALPLALMPYLGEDNSRFMRIPIVYILFISCAIASVYRSKLKVNRMVIKITFIMVIFLMYTLTTTLLKNPNLSFLSYYMMWVLNFFICIFVATISYRIKTEELIEIFKCWCKLIFLSEIIGISRYIFGISIDSNFMVMMNRNGTIFLDMLFTPILFYLVAYNINLKPKYILFFITKIIFVVMTQSRMGIITLVLSAIFYIFIKNMGNIVKLFSNTLIVIITIVIIGMTPISAGIVDRIEVTMNTIDIIVNDKPFYPGMKDYARYQMMKDCVNVIKNNTYFGTGIGLDSYRKELVKVGPIRMSKPHNFYLSYLAELGIFGFGILAWIFIIIIKSIHRRDKSFHALWYTIIFIILLMFTMNEYISLPILWMMLGLILGRSTYYRMEAIKIE